MQLKAYIGSHPSFFLFTFLLLVSACHQQELRESPNSAKENITPAQVPPSTGEPYPDSIAQALVAAEMERTRPLQIDSFRDLHHFSPERFPFTKPQKVDMKLVEQHPNINHPLTKEQQALLGATDYFALVDTNRHFSTYLFYNRSMESHYSNSIDLITIGRNTNEVHRLVLAQQYGNEGQEYEIESEWIGKNRIRQTKTEVFHAVNGQGKDSTSTLEAIYQIGESGKITATPSFIE